MPSSQRPYFLSSFLSAFRQQPPPSLPSQTKPHSHSHSHTSAASPSAAATSSASSSTSSYSASQPSSSRTGGVMNQLPYSRGMPIPQSGAASGRRRGSDSSSEGFRDVLGAEKWYIGGRTAGGEEKYFKLGVVRRVRSVDRLSLDRLSL